MKHLLLLVFTIAPTLLFAQSSTAPYEVVGLFVGIASFIGLFFLVKAAMQWYWKRNDIVKNQNESAELMREAVRRMKLKDEKTNLESEI